MFTLNSAMFFENLIIHLTQGNLIARYEYSSEGERTRRWTGSVEWWSGYGTSGEMQTDFIRNGRGSDTFVYPNGELITKTDYDATMNTSKRRRIVADQLGTPRMITDEDGRSGGVSQHGYSISAATIF